MFKYSETSCIATVEDILGNQFSSSWFSTNGPKESAVCIEKQNDENWIVYNYERGQKFQINHYSNVLDACIELIKRVSVNNSSESLIEKFIKKCSDKNSKIQYKK